MATCIAITSSTINFCKLEWLLRLLGLCAALAFAVAQNLQECVDNFDPFPQGSAFHFLPFLPHQETIEDLSAAQPASTVAS